MSLADTIRNTLVPVHREGWPFVAAFAGATVLLGLFSTHLLCICLILTAWRAYFFRDPERVTPIDDRLVISPPTASSPRSARPCRRASSGSATPR